MLSPEYKALWLKRLRDPASKQCFSALNEGGSFCALGHLGQGLREAGLLESNYPVEDGFGVYRLRDPSKDAEGDWPLTAYELLPAEAWTEVSRMNDVDRLTLTQIADWVEANL